MNIPNPNAPGTLTHRRRRIGARLLTLAATLVIAALTAALSVVSPALAATSSGAVSDFKITVTDDGTQPADLDGNNANGIIGVGNPLSMTWSITGQNLVDGTFTQTLPAGWSWDTSSLTALSSSSSVYTSTYTVNGATLTATMSIPNSSIVNIPNLRAVPSTSVANGSTYTPSVDITDGDGTSTVATTPVTVVGKNDVSLAVSLTGAPQTGTHDFGSGAEPAYCVSLLAAFTNPSTVGSLAATPDPVTASLTLSGLLPADVTSGSCSGAASAATVSSYDPQTGALQLGLDGSALGSNQASTANAYLYVSLWYPATLVTTTPQQTTLSGSLTPLTVDGGQPNSGTETVSGTMSIVQDTITPPTQDGIAPPSATGVTYAYNKAGGPALPAPMTDNLGGGSISSSTGWFATSTAAQNAPVVETSTFVLPVDKTAKLNLPVTGLVGYDFWDPTVATILDQAGNVSVSEQSKDLTSSQYTVEYTNGTDQSGPWFSSIAAAGGASAVRGVKVTFVGTVSSQPTLVVAKSLIGAVGQQDANQFSWTSDDYPVATKAAAMTVSAGSAGLSLTASPGSIVSGSPITYTTAPWVCSAPGTTDSASVDGTTLTLQFASVITGLDYSQAIANGWVASYTPANVGPDGMPGTADDVSGPTLTLTLPTVTVPPFGGCAKLPSVGTITAQTSLKAPAKGNQVLASGSFAAGQITPGTANATVTETQSNTLSMDGSVTYPIIQPTDTTLQWTADWYNFTSASVTGGAYILDVLPYNGDARGTSTAAQLSLRSATLVGQAPTNGSVLQYTTADPTTIGAVPGNGATWQLLTAGTDLSTVTALRVYIPTVDTGSFGGLAITMNTSGQSAGDQIVDNATASFVTNSTTLTSPNLPVKVIGATITGTVWNDTDNSGTLTSGDTGIPAATVSLLQGSTVIATTATGSDGTYRFSNLTGADYTVEVDPSTISGDVVPSFGPQQALDNSSGTLTVAPGQSETGVDFGYQVTHPHITVKMSGALDAGSTGHVQDGVTYTLTITNDGNTPLTDLATVLTPDALNGTLTYGTWPGAFSTLLPGQSVTAVATTTLNQADIDSGAVMAIADVSGVAPSGHIVKANTSAPVPIPQGPVIAFTKTGTLEAGETGRAGDIVDYTFTATNEGNTTVTGITIDDPLTGPGSVLPTGWSSGTPGTLAPGDTMTASAHYTLKQSDVDAGSVTNVAHLSGVTPSGEAVSQDASAPLPLGSDPSLTLTKNGTLNGAGKAGDTITYTFHAENKGNVTLSNVDIADQLLSPTTSPISYTWPGAPGVLAPGESVDATATYVLTQNDVDSGAVTNSATVDAETPEAAPVSATDTKTIPIVPNPQLEFHKTATIADGNTPHVGDPVTYTFTVTNQGNTTITGIAIQDKMLGSSPLTVDPSTLAPGASATVSAAYKLTQEDIDSGAVTNTATVTGTSSTGGQASATDSATVELPDGPGATLTETAELAAGSTGAPGDTVEYTYLIHNAGNTTLTLNGLTGSVSNPSTVAALTVAPGQSITVTGTGQLTQADIDAGTVSDIAHLDATSATGLPVTADTTASVPVPTRPEIQLIKQAEREGGATAAIGDIIHYTFTITNSGSTTLNSVSLDDALNGLSALRFGAWPGSAGVLAPGQHVTAVADYAVTAQDLAAGAVSNTATATGSSGSSTAPEPVSDTSGATVALPSPTQHAVTLPGQAGSTNEPAGDGSGSSPDAFGQLAHTGMDVTVPIGVGGALLAAGLILIALRLRRKENA